MFAIPVYGFTLIPSAVFGDNGLSRSCVCVFVGRINRIERERVRLRGAETVFGSACVCVCWRWRIRNPLNPKGTFWSNVGWFIGWHNARKCIGSAAPSVSSFDMDTIYVCDPTDGTHIESRKYRWIVSFGWVYRESIHFMCRFLSRVHADIHRTIVKYTGNWLH